jgi:hypothetical protein
VLLLCNKAESNLALKRLGLHTVAISATDGLRKVASFTRDTLPPLPALRLSEMWCGVADRGYFKLVKGQDESNFSGSQSHRKLLLVTFGSAPGEVNWGGLVSQLRSSKSCSGMCEPLCSRVRASCCVAMFRNVWHCLCAMLCQHCQPLL